MSRELVNQYYNGTRQNIATFFDRTFERTKAWPPSIHNIQRLEYGSHDVDYSHFFVGVVSEKWINNSRKPVAKIDINFQSGSEIFELSFLISTAQAAHIDYNQGSLQWVFTRKLIRLPAINDQVVIEANPDSYHYAKHWAIWSEYNLLMYRISTQSPQFFSTVQKDLKKPKKLIP